METAHTRPFLESGGEFDEEDAPRDAEARRKVAWKRAVHPLFHAFELTSHGRGLHASAITSSVSWFFRSTILRSGGSIESLDRIIIFQTIFISSKMIYCSKINFNSKTLINDD